MRSNAPDGYQITAADSDRTVKVPSGRNVLLPTPDPSIVGMRIWIYKDGTGSPVTVTPSGGSTINGSAGALSIPGNRSVRLLQLDFANNDWLILGSV